jgi:hypothetical protein
VLLRLLEFQSMTWKGRIGPLGATKTLPFGVKVPFLTFSHAFFDHFFP